MTEPASPPPTDVPTAGVVLEAIHDWDATEKHYLGGDALPYEEGDRYYGAPDPDVQLHIILRAIELGLLDRQVMAELRRRLASGAEGAAGGDAGAHDVAAGVR